MTSRYPILNPDTQLACNLFYLLSYVSKFNCYLSVQGDSTNKYTGLGDADGFL